MADELWIVGDEESHAWSVDAKGKVTTNDDYPIDGERVVIGVADSPLTQKQADGIRGLICDLRKDGVLDFNPAVGVQYPQRTTVLNVEQAMRYLHAWTDDCDEEWHTFMLTYGEFVILATQWPDDDLAFVEYFIAKMKNNMEK